jgi:hypothetical protein
MDDDFAEFRDTNDMTTSEALRTLVRTGLEEHRKDPLDDRPETALAGLLWDARRDVHKFLIAGVLAFLASQLATGLVATGFFLVACGYALTVTVAGLDAMLLDSALLRRVMSPSGDVNGVEA